MKIAVIQIDKTYKTPPGTLHLNSNGWVVDCPEILKVQTNLPLSTFVEKLSEQNHGILGEGELVLAVFDLEGETVKSAGLTNVKEYQGRILFSPEQ
jgi:hypothetical protein